MQKQYLLAILLIFVVIYGWQALFPPPRKAPAPQPAPQQVTTAPTTTAPTSPAATPAVPAVEASTPVVAASAEQDIAVENSAVSAVFTTRGGVLKSWRLKNYRDGRGEPLELIPNIPGAPKPFTPPSPDGNGSRPCPR